MRTYLTPGDATLQSMYNHSAVERIQFSLSPLSHSSVDQLVVRVGVSLSLFQLSPKLCQYSMTEHTSLEIFPYIPQHRSVALGPPENWQKSRLAEH